MVVGVARDLAPLPSGKLRGPRPEPLPGPRAKRLSALTLSAPGRTATAAADSFDREPGSSRRSREPESGEILPRPRDFRSQDSDRHCPSDIPSPAPGGEGQGEGVSFVAPLVDRQTRDEDGLAPARAFVLARRARPPTKRRIVDSLDIDEPSLKSHVVSLSRAGGSLAQARGRRNQVRISRVCDDRAAVEGGGGGPPHI